jgi:hypothetical protein
MINGDVVQGLILVVAGLDCQRKRQTRPTQLFNSKRITPGGPAKFRKSLESEVWSQKPKNFCLRLQTPDFSHLKRTATRPLNNRGKPTCVPLKTDSKL